MSEWREVSAHNIRAFNGDGEEIGTPSWLRLFEPVDPPMMTIRVGHSDEWTDVEIPEHGA